MRYVGPARVEKFLRRMCDAVRDEDPEALVTYVNYPTTEYLDLHFLDLISMNVYLEDEETSDLTTTGNVLGTLRFMAPEQIGGVFDNRSDIYSLGITLYELITGYPAFENGTRFELLAYRQYHQPRPPRRYNGRLARDLETIVLKAIAKELDIPVVALSQLRRHGRRPGAVPRRPADPGPAYVAG